MFPQYAERRTGGEIAIWLLLTVGALLIPIIIIAICCIRRHLARRPRVKLLERRPPKMMMMMNMQDPEAVRTYNGPYTESNNDDAGNNSLPSYSRTNSLKKQHVHWPDNCEKTKPFDEYILNAATILNESPSANRRSNNLNQSTSIHSYKIETTSIPVNHQSIV